MENDTDAKKTGFKLYAAKHIIVGILVTVAALWVVGTGLGLFGKSKTAQVAQKHDEKAAPILLEHKTPIKVVEHKTEKEPAAGHAAPAEKTSGHAAVKKTDIREAEPVSPAHPVKTAADREAAHGEVTVTAQTYRPKGAAFVEAAIKPMDYELNERFWGWRPNDILNFTDNVNNFQLGVLEVTRRTVVILTERLSRTGATASFNPNLENAMNWFMIKAKSYWFPTPESKYKAGLKELKAYKEKLEKGEAQFHTRTDNLIPLLMAYEDLLGSCEENLVKLTEADGSPVSFFKSDDYFFYAKGVASAMSTVLEAVQEDFLVIVETRRGKEVLNHAIESCHHIADVDPLIITNS
ncbi:MAG: DUF2333 family protein, partial [Pseudomonadota bacterium]